MTLKAAIIHNGKVLLLHSTASHQRWEFPGGIVNINESFSNGLTREVQEETTLAITIGDPIGVWDEWRNGFRFLDGSVHDVRVVEIIYQCTIGKGSIKLSEEHSEYTWTAKDDLLKLSMFPLQREAVTKIL